MSNEPKDVQFGDPELMRLPEGHTVADWVKEEITVERQNQEDSGGREAEHVKVELTRQALALALLYEQAAKLPNREGLSKETVTEVLDTGKWMNGAIAGKTILSVEPGRTAGWLVINLAPAPEPTTRLFLTAWCGGAREHLDPNHDWDIALHFEQEKEGRFVGGITRPIYRSHEPEGLPDLAIVALARQILVDKTIATGTGEKK